MTCLDLDFPVFVQGIRFCFASFDTFTEILWWRSQRAADKKIEEEIKKNKEKIAKEHAELAEIFQVCRACARGCNRSPSARLLGSELPHKTARVVDRVAGACCVRYCRARCELRASRAVRFCLTRCEQWMYVSVISYFQLIDLFSFMLAFIIFFGLLYRVVGTTVYQACGRSVGQYWLRRWKQNSFDLV